MPPNELFRFLDFGGVSACAPPDGDTPPRGVDARVSSRNSVCCSGGLGWDSLDCGGDGLKVTEGSSGRGTFIPKTWLVPTLSFRKRAVGTKGEDEQYDKGPTPVSKAMPIFARMLEIAVNEKGGGGAY